MKIEAYLRDKKQIVESGLERLMLEAHGPFKDHIEAMRYSLFVGGKRIRPVLCLAAAEAISDEPRLLEALLPVACAIECIHTYSLIHDDLPAMDDDELRRGRPTNHMVYGEAEAILAGDALLTFAFELLSNPIQELASAAQLRIINLVARAAGAEGMTGGQSLDIAGENNELPFAMLQTIHRSKTGALIRCCLEAGGVGAGANRVQLKCLSDYGTAIGLAFQIVDDLLDATATTEQLGKTAGLDQRRGKATYPAYFGIDQTRHLARQAVEDAKSALSPLGDRALPLAALADYIYARTH
jgi:geranylgeranyl diphosphate synthase type II